MCCVRHRSGALKQAAVQHNMLAELGQSEPASSLCRKPWHTHTKWLRLAQCTMPDSFSFNKPWSQTPGSLIHAAEMSCCQSARQVEVHLLNRQVQCAVLHMLPADKNEW